jgi:hypothetical protein
MTNKTEAVRAEPVAWPNGEIRLWDTQWTNCINHDNRYSGWDKEDAIAHAIKMTERYMRQNYENENPASEIARLTGEVERLTAERDEAVRKMVLASNDLNEIAEECEAAERRVSELREAGNKLLEAMQMQEGREARRLHISSIAFMPIWNRAINQWKYLTQPEADHV